MHIRRATANGLTSSGHSFTANLALRLILDTLTPTLNEYARTVLPQMIRNVDEGRDIPSIDYLETIVGQLAETDQFVRLRDLIASIHACAATPLSDHAHPLLLFAINSINNDTLFWAKLSLVLATSLIPGQSGETKTMIREAYRRRVETQGGASHEVDTVVASWVTSRHRVVEESSLLSHVLRSRLFQRMTTLSLRERERLLSVLDEFLLRDASEDRRTGRMLLTERMHQRGVRDWVSGLDPRVNTISIGEVFENLFGSPPADTPAASLLPPTYVYQNPRDAIMKFSEVEEFFQRHPVAESVFRRIFRMDTVSAGKEKIPPHQVHRFPETLALISERIRALEQCTDPLFEYVRMRQPEYTFSPLRFDENEAVDYLESLQTAFHTLNSMNGCARRTLAIGLFCRLLPDNR